MKRTELRIGNFVNTLDGILKADGIGEYVLIEKYAHSFSDIKPIPLTEEILLKCGFVKLGNEFHFWEASVFNIENINGIWHICYIDVVLSTHVKYLHQLQNFYHSIMDKELQIKL